MKTRLLIIIGFSLILGFGTAYGQYLGDKLPPNTMYDDETGKDVLPPSYADFYYSNPEFEKYSVIAGHYRYDIPYKISNGTISEARIDCSNTELVINVTSSEKQDWVTFALPRYLIDSKMGSHKDDNFFVLLDSMETHYSDIAAEKLRILIIPVSNETSQIRIIGVSYPEHVGENACNGKHDPPFAYLLSPLKQLKSGIDKYQIECKPDFYLVYKFNGSPACVSIETKAALIHRSWANGEKSVAGKILEELRKGPQGITEEQSDYVKKIILLDPQVQELISGREYDFHCCAYVSDNNHYPYHHTLSITININNSSDQIVVGFDLDEVKISSVSEGLQRGSGGVVPFKPEHGPERITPP